MAKGERIRSSRLSAFSSQCLSVQLAFDLFPEQLIYNIYFLEKNINIFFLNVLARTISLTFLTSSPYFCARAFVFIKFRSYRIIPTNSLKATKGMLIRLFHFHRAKYFLFSDPLNGHYCSFHRGNKMAASQTLFFFCTTRLHKKIANCFVLPWLVSCSCS